MRLPPMDVLDPERVQDWIVDAETDQSGTIFIDGQANFSTATVLTALDRVKVFGHLVLRNRCAFSLSSRK